MIFYFAIYALVAVGIIFYSLTTISELEKRNKISESKYESEKRRADHWHEAYVDLTKGINKLHLKLEEMKRRYQECANKDV